jgi:hypothetical protein
MSIRTSALLVTAVLLAACTAAQQAPAPAVTSQAAAAIAPSTTFANPIDLEYRFELVAPHRRTAADPLIVPFGDEYYLFASKSGGYWHSRDFRDWALVVPVGLEMEAYAPAVLVIGDTMYYTAHRTKEMLATTDPKRGTWRKVADIAEYADPMLFRDDDGRVYLYHGSALNGVVAVDELDPRNGFRAIGRRDTLMHANYLEHGWERSGADNLGAVMAEGFRIGPYIEGPWMTKHDGVYYLQYSAPGTVWNSYADGVYTGPTPRGPFTYQPYNPFSYKPGGFIGSAGHAGTFQDRQGNYWRVVTMVISVRHKFERRLGIFPAGFDADGVMRTETWLGDYPQFFPGIAGNPLEKNQPGWLVVSARRPVTASSSLQAHPPARAVDENIMTHWSATSGAAGEWLQVDLGSVATVNALQVNLAEEGATALGRTNVIAPRYRVEGSVDGARWSMLLDRSTNDRDRTHDYVQLAAPVAARYVRLSNVRAAAGGTFSVRDLRVFGRAPGATPAVVSGVTVRRDPKDDRTVTISWQRVPRAYSYVVRFGIAPDKLYGNYQVDDVDTLTMNSLNVGVDYWFTVDAVGASGVTRGVTVIPAPAQQVRAGQ